MSIQWVSFCAKSNYESIIITLDNEEMQTISLVFNIGQFLINALNNSAIIVPCLMEFNYIPNFSFEPGILFSSGFHYQNMINAHSLFINTKLDIASKMELFNTLPCHNVSCNFISSSTVKFFLCHKFKLEILLLFLSSSLIYHTVPYYTKLSYTWFIDKTSYILEVTRLLRAKLYSIHAAELIWFMLKKIYHSIKHIVRQYFPSWYYKDNCTKNLICPVLQSKHKLCLSVPNIYSISLPYNVLVRIAAVFTVAYFFLGLIIDYLNIIFIIRRSSTNMNNLRNFSFWYSRGSIGTIYIIWLITGIFGSNGVYFSTSTNLSNLTIALVGSITTYFFITIWYWLGNISLDLRSNIIHSFFRAFFEAGAFYSMVYSTYGTWDLYLSVFHALNIWAHFIVWTTGSLLFTYVLILIEETRPHIGFFLYGMFYLFTWTCACFATNSIATLFTVNNAITIIIAIIPINLLLTFIENVRLYRYTRIPPTTTIRTANSIRLGNLSRNIDTASSSSPSLDVVSANNRFYGRILRVISFILVVYVTLLLGAALWTIYIS